LVAATMRTSHRDLLLAAHRADAACFQRAQQRGLQRQRQLADLVEEQRAALGIDEQSPLATAGLAEELGLDRRRREDGAQFTGTKGAAACGSAGAAPARPAPCRCPIRRSAAPC
jgi:hypothetical protein